MYPPAPDERLISVAEFQKLPEEDSSRIELVRGRLVREPRPASLHGVTSARLAARLQEYIETRGRGLVLVDVGVVLARAPDTVRGPDIAYFTPERIPETRWGESFWGPPDLVVEILSPSNRRGEMREKVTEYLDAGVHCVWVVDPSGRSVTVSLAGGVARSVGHDGILECDEVLPEFQLEVAALFAR